jgi:acyl-CoA thioesterase-1
MNSILCLVRQVLTRKFCVFLLPVVWLAACGQPQATAPGAPHTTPRIEAPSAEGEIASTPLTVVFLGDSLTAGYGLEPEDALPEQVEAVWRSQGIDAVAVNAGVSGDTTANALARFDWSVAAAEPDLLIVALGANDFLLDLPADAARANLAAILERAKSASIPVVLVGLTPRGSIEPGSREEAFAAIYPSLAAEFDVPLYPSLLASIERAASMLQPDGLHPTRDGVVSIARPLAEFLNPVLTELEQK